MMIEDHIRDLLIISLLHKDIASKSCMKSHIPHFLDPHGILFSSVYIRGNLHLTYIVEHACHGDLIHRLIIKPHSPCKS